MNDLKIDDAMVALASSGKFGECWVEEFIGRTALLQMLEKQGYDGTGGVRDLAAAIDRWRVQTGRNGRVSTADLRAAVLDGRIAPTARVYESDWTQMTGTTDLDERLQLATAIKDRLTGVYRYYEQRLSSVNDEIDAIHAQRPMRLDLDPVLSDKG